MSKRNSREFKIQEVCHFLDAQCTRGWTKFWKHYESNSSMNFLNTNRSEKETKILEI